jgi:hypothetical protein
VSKVCQKASSNTWILFNSAGLTGPASWDGATAGRTEIGGGVAGQALDHQQVGSIVRGAKVELGRLEEAGVAGCVIEEGLQGGGFVAARAAPAWPFEGAREGFGFADLQIDLNMFCMLSHLLRLHRLLQILVIVNHFCFMYTMVESWKCLNSRVETVFTSNTNPTEQKTRVNIITLRTLYGKYYANPQ